MQNNIFDKIIHKNLIKSENNEKQSTSIKVCSISKVNW